MDVESGLVVSTVRGPGAVFASKAKSPGTLYCASNLLRTFPSSAGDALADIKWPDTATADPEQTLKHPRKQARVGFA